MTDSDVAAAPAERRLPGKRERLVAAACQLLYTQGVERTTLADIAQAAGIPLGNVYYYFKTKNDIIEAVVQGHVADIHALLDSLERRHRSPKARLKALFAEFARQRDDVAKYGCPHGSLCLELDKRADGPDVAAADLIRIPIGWAQRQFEAMGRPDAHDLAIRLMVGYQGTALITSALRDPELMARETRHLEGWIDTLD